MAHFFKKMRNLQTAFLTGRESKDWVGSRSLKTWNKI